MSNSPNGKNKFPWLKISISALMLIIVTGIYIYKNSTYANENTSSTPQNSTEAKKALPKLVDLGASTCIPCKEMAPILADLKKDYKGIVDVEVVDVYKDNEKANEYNAKHPIRVIPTQILFDANGKEVWSHEGSLPKVELIQIFKEKVGIK